MPGNSAKPLTVSMITGVVMPRDAISNVCREQMEAIARYGRLHHLPIDLKVYACDAPIPDTRIVVTRDPAAVVADPHFLASDLILYHFGIYYPLFDSIHFAPRSARTVVTFYGITHPSLLHEEVRDSLYQSFRQGLNLHVADQILVTSQFLTAELQRMRVPLDKVTQIILPASFDRLPDAAARRPPGAVLRLVYVGRFVSAKGVRDLLEAFRVLRAGAGRPVRLDLVGSGTFSDPVYLAQLREFIAVHDLGADVHFHLDASDAELARLLLEAEALVIPSFHEGFCVPVIEAMACGCFVICSDAGALPETSGGLGRLFPVGNAEVLAERLMEFAHARNRGGYMTEGGFLSRAEWQTQARAYCAGFTRSRFQERFWNAVLEKLSPRDEEVRAGLAQARIELAARLRGSAMAPARAKAIYARVAKSLAASVVEAANAAA